MAAYNPFNTTITTATTSTTLVPRKTYNQFKKHEKQNLHPKKDKINHDSRRTTTAIAKTLNHSLSQIMAHQPRR